MPNILFFVVLERCARNDGHFISGKGDTEINGGAAHITIMANLALLILSRVLNESSSVDSVDRNLRPIHASAKLQAR